MNNPIQSLLKRSVRLHGRWMAAAAALLFFGGLAFCGSARAAEEPSDTETVKLDIRYGYDNMAKGGRYLPLEVTVQNEESQALSGTLRVKSVESDGTIYSYEYDVQAEADAETASRYYIPLGTGADRLAVSLEDGHGGVVAEETVKLNVSRDVPELFIGILSDEPEKLSWMNGVGVSYSTLRTRTFALQEMDFPEDEVGLNLLDVLVVNNYKLRSLSELQTGAIMDWVHGGGVLILGTGERVDDTLGRFAPELLDNSYEAAALRHINLAENYTLDEPGGGMFAIPCVDISLHGGNVIISSSGFPLLTAAAKEQGLIGVAAFDLGEIASFCQQNAGYVDYLFTGLLGEDRINRLAEASYSGNSGKFWSVQTLINTGNLNKLPKLVWYAVVVAVYLILLGPALYLFLKNRELQIYYRRGVAVLSLLFAALIYVMGSATRFRSTFFTYATIQDTTLDYVADTTFVNIRNPYNRPYTVELNPDYTVLPITRTTQAGYTDEVSLDEPYQISIERTEDQVTVRGQNISAFTPRYFQLEKKSENTDQVGITGEVDYFEGRISGSLTNGFPFPIENTTVILYGNMVQAGRMEAGETKKLEDFALLRFPLGNSYVVSDWVSGESAFHTMDIKNQEYLLAMERSNLLKFYLDNYMTGYMADARVIAFSTQKEESQFLKRGSDESYGMTMLTSAVDVNASRDRTLYRSVLMKLPEVVNGIYDASGNSMGGMEPLTLEYRLGTDIDVESLTFESVNEVFLEAGGNSFTAAFTGSVYFYNYGTGNFDLMELEGRTLDVEELTPYLSPENTLTVRYVYDGTSIYNAIQLPMPMVAGRER